MLCMADDDTELAPSEAPTEHAFAWALDADEDDYTEAYEDDDPAWGDAEERAYAWGTVKMFMSMMAVVVAAAAILSWIWWSTHHGETTTGAGSLATSTPPAAAPSGPDDRILTTPSAAPAPSSAPPLSVDDQYLAALNRDGISSAAGPSSSLGIAHAVCRAVDRGETRTQIASEIQQANPNLTLLASQFIMTTAIHFYCPPPTG